MDMKSVYSDRRRFISVGALTHYASTDVTSTERSLCRIARVISWIMSGEVQKGLRLIVERLFVERLFTDGQLMDGHYVELAKFTKKHDEFIRQ